MTSENTGYFRPGWCTWTKFTLDAGDFIEIFTNRGHIKINWIYEKEEEYITELLMYAYPMLYSDLDKNNRAKFKRGELDDK